MSTTTIKHKHNKTSLQQGIPSQDLQHVIACYDLGCCVQFAALLSSGQLIQLCYDLCYYVQFTALLSSGQLIQLCYDLCYQFSLLRCWPPVS